MYVIREGNRLPVKIQEGTLVEGFSVDWKSSKTWLIVGIAAAIIIALLVLIFALKKKY
jgi:hypothetical protein